MKRIAIFVSGSGTNMENIITCIKKKKIRGVDVALVLSDKADAPALKKAGKQKVETLFIDPKKYASKKEYEEHIVRELRMRRVDFIVLAGFMRILTPFLVNSYKNRILNIHPSLLPSFKGAHGIRDAYQYGVRVAGVTIHFVTDELDGGPIIVQKSFDVKKNESLVSFEKRIHALEYELYPQAIQLVVRGKVAVKRGQVVFI
jgi:phosphoribosylglycinamide formyltransferase-1